MSAEEVLQYYKKKNTLLNRVIYYFKFIWRFALEKVAFFCFIKEIRWWLQRLRGVDIGKDVYIGADVIIDRVYPDLVHIGDHSSVGDYSLISAHANIPMNTPVKKLYPTKIAPIRIGKGVWMMPHVIIAPGVTIGDYSVIATGAIITKDIPPMVLATGVPAKPVKDLSEMLKKEITKKEYVLLMKKREKMGYP